MYIKQKQKGQYQIVSVLITLLQLEKQIFFKEDVITAAVKQTKQIQNAEWIDYSSEEENDHHNEEKPTKQHHPPTQKLESKTIYHNSSQQHKNLPLLSTSHQPVNFHLLQDKKELLDQLRMITGNTVWIVLSPKDEKDADYLKQWIQNLKQKKNKQVINIYPSRDNKNDFDLRLQWDLCEKWIVQGFDKKKLIKLKLKRKPEQPKKQQKYEQKDRNYRPVKQNAPQHTSSTRYQYRQKQFTNKPSYKEKVPAKNNHYQQKNSQKRSTFTLYRTEYIEKNPIAEQIEQKVEEKLQQRKLQKKEKGTKKYQGSKFYSKNPFEALNDSD